MLPKKKWKNPSPDSEPLLHGKDGTTVRLEKDLMDLALRALARRAFSRAEMISRLEKAGGSEAAIQNIVSRLHSYGYLDDRKYAEAFLLSRREQKPLGRNRIARELLLRGIEPGLIEEVMNASYPKQEEDNTLERALEKKVRSLSFKIDPAIGIDAKIIARLYNYLFRLGFPPDNIHRTLRKKFRGDFELE
jgi:regulatory protein